MYRSSLLKVLSLLRLPATKDGLELHGEEWVNASMSAIEARVLELLASSDAEKVMFSQCVWLVPHGGC